MATKAKAKPAPKASKNNKGKKPESADMRGFYNPLPLLKITDPIRGLGGYYSVKPTYPKTYRPNLFPEETAFLAARLAVMFTAESKRHSEDAYAYAASFACAVEQFALATGDTVAQENVKSIWAHLGKKFGAKIKPAPKDDPTVGRTDFFTIAFKSGRSMRFYPSNSRAVFPRDL
jgi:hypothetical protein